ncbi:unnamed protein product [Ectocarpus sp. CCAP 1310/34]|nr:unnamed protein product [Ectocarpus sp. CCAP 1310/34]
MRSVLYVQGPRPAAPHADRDMESHGRPHRPGVPAGGEFDLKLSASRLQRSESTDHLIAASELAEKGVWKELHELSAMRTDATASLAARVAQRDTGDRPMEEADDATRAAATAMTTAVAVPSEHGNRGSRHLQADESCEFGASFELSSTLYSAYNGCYASLDSTLDPYFFWTESFDAFIGPAPSIFGSTSMDYTTSDNPAQVARVPPGPLAANLGPGRRVRSSSDPCRESTIVDNENTNVFSAIAVVVDARSTPLKQLAWNLGEVLAIGKDGEISYSMACESWEFVAIGSHPSDVTQWLCEYTRGIGLLSACLSLVKIANIMSFLGVELVFVSADSFSLTCGCSDNPTPAPESGSTTPAPATSPVDDDGSPVGASGCGGTDEFTISSSELEEFDGCYVDAGETETFFSTSGEKADGVMAVSPGFLDEQEIADVSVEEPSPETKH